MASLTIRNIEDGVKERLRVRAATHGHSMEEEARAITTTAITLSEIEFGLQRLPDGSRRQALHASFEAVIGALAVLPLDDVAARQAGRLRASRHAAGLSSQASDMMIAGIVFVADAALAIRNTKGFEGLGIELLDPWRFH